MVHGAGARAMRRTRLVQPPYAQRRCDGAPPDNVSATSGGGVYGLHVRKGYAVSAAVLGARLSRGAFRARATPPVVFWCRVSRPSQSPVSPVSSDTSARRGAALPQPTPTHVQPGLA